jgi:thioredoxin 1
VPVKHSGAGDRETGMSTLIAPIATHCFEDDVLRADGLAVIEFGTRWSPVSRLLHASIEAVAPDFAASVRFFRVHLEDEPLLAIRYGIQQVPVLLALRQGRTLGRREGALSTREIQEQLADWLQAAVTNDEPPSS